jgi:hypothetical protein
MATNYFIGIGGTGARAAEALVHLCGAGYGPGDLSIFLVDPDESNGNLNRTKAAITHYQDARNSLGERRESMQVAGTDLATPDPLVWNVLERGDMRLADYIKHSNLEAKTHSDDEAGREAGRQGLADFARVLFSEDELDERLNKGFRGHPSIGATVMSDHDDSTDPWKTFWEDLENSAGTDAMRVFLAGSVFGGTGAAGIPTFGTPEMIKEHPKAQTGEGSKVHLGAALVLPYFTFDVEDRDRLFVTSADFPIATKAALQFYDEKKLAFDEMYFLGDSLSQNVGEFSPGSRDQENRPHYIEVATALAAYDFFESDESEAGGDSKYFTAGRTSQRVDWDALPVSRHRDAVQPRRDALKRQLATMTAFAYAFLDYGLPLLETPAGDVSAAWHQDHFYSSSLFFGQDTSLDPRQPEQKQSLERVGTYARQFLAWVTALDEGKGGAVDLIDRSKLVSARNGSPELRDHNEHEHSIGTFMEPSRQMTFGAFINELNGVRIEDESMSPADKFVNLFYEAARRFCKKNYEIA